MIEKLQEIWRKLSRIKKLLLVVGGVLLLFFLFSAFKPKEIHTVVVKKGDITQSVLVSGNAISNGQTPIFTTTTGVISHLFVANGDTIVSGQKLFSVKSTASDSDKQAAYATYQAALSTQNTALAGKPLIQSQLEIARQQVINASQAVDTMTNNRNVSKNNPATGLPYTQDEIDSINSGLTSARENFSSLEKQFISSDQTIDSAKSQVAAKWTAYQATQDSTITAPTDGTIVNLAYVVGDRVTASPQEKSAETTPVLLIANFSEALVKITINESDITKVKVGQDVSITFDAIANKTYQGSVFRVDEVGTNTQGVITYHGFITLTNPDQNIQSGMTANVSITTAKKYHVLLTPNVSLQIVNGQTSVSMQKNGKQAVVPVRIGIKDKNNSEVLDGLSEGDTIIIQ